MRGTFHEGYRSGTAGNARGRWFRVMLAVAIGTLIAFPLAAQRAELEEQLDRVDELLEQEAADRALAVLADLPDGFEVFWRRSAATLAKGDQRADAGAEDAEVLQIYEEGEAIADQAIASNPNSALGYYWKSAHIGRWGQTRGVLNSLFRAPSMRDLLEEAINREPDHADSYFVLGQLYSKVPSLISFGNNAYGVSLGRRAVDLMERELAAGERPKRAEAFYVELAASLIERGWNARRRSRQLNGIRRDYQSAATALEQGYYFEGSLNVPSGSDAQEARQILEAAVNRLERIPQRTPGENRRLDQARDLLSDL